MADTGGSSGFSGASLKSRHRNLFSIKIMINTLGKGRKSIPPGGD